MVHGRWFSRGACRVLAQTTLSRRQTSESVCQVHEFVVDRAGIRWYSYAKYFTGTKAEFLTENQRALRMRALTTPWRTDFMQGVRSRENKSYFGHETWSEP
jgi:hypothetical protein